MKRLLSLAAMLLVCCVTLFAQQALWGGAAVVSPDIHDDNTVTFRLKAPKAVRVQITGDFPFLLSPTETKCEFLCVHWH
jgi:enterochelin esterase family protein